MSFDFTQKHLAVCCFSWCFLSFPGYLHMASFLQNYGILLAQNMNSPFLPRVCVGWGQVDGGGMCLCEYMIWVQSLSKLETKLSKRKMGL